MDRLTVAQRREALGLSRAELADAVGVDHATIWRWEANVSQPRGLSLRALEDTLSRLERAAVVSSEAAS